MKYVISFTICLFSVALVHGQPVPKKHKKRTKPLTTVTTTKPALAKTELDEVVPASSLSANPKKTDTPIAQKTNTTDSKPISSAPSEAAKTPIAPSVFSVRGTPKEDESADMRKPSVATHVDFDETEVQATKAKLSTNAPLKPESTVLESTPFGPMPQRPTPIGQMNEADEVPKLSVRSDPKQDEAQPAVTAQPAATPVNVVSSPVQPVVAPAKEDLATRGETVAPAKPVEAIASTASKGLAIMTFEQKTKDLGRMRLGETRDHSFTFTNKGNEAVEIELMDVCPCTALEWDKNPIPPGATSTIKARFNSQKVFPEGVNHEIEKVITIILKNTDPKNGYPLIEELKLKAFVEYQFQD
jgi:Protein of unknown function (DUF1573)